MFIGASHNLTSDEGKVIGKIFNGCKNPGVNEWDGNGGGGTDFRKKGGSWETNLDSRIIVAGGGGSARARLHGLILVNYKGGDGGGEEGKPGKANQCSSAYGTQKKSLFLPCSNSSITHYDGDFGFGGSGSWSGGGGGYYGGGAIYNGAGGGGSGYIGGVTSIASFRAVTESSTHKGPGYAEITILSSFDFLNKYFYTCNKKLLFFSYSLILIIFGLAK